MTEGNEAKVYFCDPGVNELCAKTGCFLRGGPCCCTTDPECAMKNQNGTPIECLQEEDMTFNSDGKLDAWLKRFHFDQDKKQYTGGN